VVSCLALILSVHVSSALDPALEDDAMKAAFVYKFAHFVTWPDPSVAVDHEHSAIQVCVTGRASFEQALIETVASHPASATEIEIRRIEPGDETTSCQMLFIAASVSTRSSEILDRVGSLPILTIGESEGFAERGGMINFSQEGRKIRLQVNRHAAERSGLKVSSQVLKLAQLVAEDPE
jgi:hypothetical protein